MKQIISVLSIIALSVYLIGCNKQKEETYQVEGFVIHNVSKKPIANETLLISVREREQKGPATPEFPNGQYDWVIKKYTAVSDINGHYSIKVKKDGFASLPFVELYNSKYILLYTKWAIPSYPFQDSTIISTSFRRNIFDTVFVESPAYVKYAIKNTSPAFDDDTLFVRTPWQRKTVHYGFVSHDTNFYIHRLPEIGPFNWIIIGKTVDTTIIDTIPGESNLYPEVIYFSKRTDTLLHKKELLTINPNTITNYNIQY